MIKHDGYAVWFEKKDGKWKGHLEGDGLSVSGAPGVLVLALRNVPHEKLEKELSLEDAKEILLSAFSDKTAFKSFLYWELGRDFWENGVYDLSENYREQLKECGDITIDTGYGVAVFDELSGMAGELDRYVDDAYDNPMTDFDMAAEGVWRAVNGKGTGLNRLLEEIRAQIEKAGSFEELEEAAESFGDLLRAEVKKLLALGVVESVWRALADENPVKATVVSAGVETPLNDLDDDEKERFMEALGEALTPATKDLGILYEPENRVIGGYVVHREVDAGEGLEFKHGEVYLKGVFNGLEFPDIDYVSDVTVGFSEILPKVLSAFREQLVLLEERLKPEYARDVKAVRELTEKAAEKFPEVAKELEEEYGIEPDF